MENATGATGPQYNTPGATGVTGATDPAAITVPTGREETPDQNVHRAPGMERNPAPAQRAQPTGHGGQPLQRPDNPQTDPNMVPATVQTPGESPVPTGSEPAPKT